MANAQMPEGTQSSEQAPSATPEDLEARIASTRERLAGSVDDLVERADPMSIAESGLARAKAWFVDPQTGLRTDRVAKVAGGVMGFLMLRRIIRRGS